MVTAWIFLNTQLPGSQPGEPYNPPRVSTSPPARLLFVRIPGIGRAPEVGARRRRRSVRRSVRRGTALGVGRDGGVDGLVGAGEVDQRILGDEGVRRSTLRVAVRGRSPASVIVTRDKILNF